MIDGMARVVGLVVLGWVFWLTGCFVLRPTPTCRWSCGCGEPGLALIERVGSCDFAPFEQWCDSICAAVPPRHAD